MNAVRRALALVALLGLNASASFGAPPPIAAIGNDVADAQAELSAGGDRWQGFGGLSGGCDGNVRDILRAPDGQIYLAGGFRSCNGVAAPGVARFDPATSTFHPLGEGISGTILELEWFNGELLVGGMYLQDSGHAVLRWDGSSWLPLVPGVDGEFSPPTVHSMKVVDGHLVVGGSFLHVGGAQVNRVARWNGTAWTGYASGVGVPFGDPSTLVQAIVQFNGELVVAGKFISGPEWVINVARWDGAAWRSMGQGLSGFVKDLLVDGDGLVAAGGFGPTAYQVQRWDGSTWTPLSPTPTAGFDLPVEALEMYAGSILALGLFKQFDGAPIDGLARWTGSTWVEFPGAGAIPSGGGEALLSVEDQLYVGAAFLDSAARGLHNVSRWADDGWHRLGDAEGHGLEADVKTLIERDGRILATGNFQRAGDRATPGIAEWDGLGWRRLGEAGGAPGVGIRAVEVVDGVVYASGDFMLAGQPIAGEIMRWSGGEWEPLGGGVDGQVWAISEFQGDVVVAGSFESAGGAPIRAVARWDGQGWAPLLDAQGGGLGPNDFVRSMVVWGNRLIVAGYINSVAGSPAYDLAAWDGSAWTALPAGAWNSPYQVSLAVWNNDLYVTSPTGQLLRLSGSSWVPLLSWPDEGVHSIAGVGDALYLGGSFTNLAGSGANRLARLRNGQFEPVAGGVSVGNPYGASVNALAEHRGDLLVAGRFGMAGDVRTANIARLQLDVLDGIELYARKAQPTVTTNEGPVVVHYQLDIGNRGRGSAPATILSVQAEPSPTAISWSCVPLAMSVATCPADQGTGAPDFNVDLPPGSALRLLVVVESDPETVFQRLRLDLSGQPAPGATSNTPTASLTLVTPVQGQALIRNGFEPFQ